MKCRVMIARFPGQQSEHPDSSNWVMQTAIRCRPRADPIQHTDRFIRYECDHPRISELVLWWRSDTPITMVRNLAVEDAQSLGVDFLLMIDNDMTPDQPGPGAKPFWETAFDFLYRREAPAVIGAPYVGPGQHQNIYVFRWRNFNNWEQSSRANYSLGQYTRDEAAARGGIEAVAALPTGLIMYDMRLFGRLKHPYFYYEMNPQWSKKESTEDVTNTRDIALAWSDVPGAGCFCAWDCWAEHVKLTHFGRPIIPTTADLGNLFRETADKGFNAGEKVVIVGDDKPLAYPQFPRPNGQPPAADNRLVMVDTAEMIKKVRAAYPELVRDGNDREI